MSKAEELAEEMLRLADLSDAGRGPAKSDPRRQAATELRRLAALEKAIMEELEAEREETKRWRNAAKWEQEIRKQAEMIADKAVTEHAALLKAISDAEPAAWYAPAIDGRSVARFDGRPMLMVGAVGNEIHTAPLYTLNGIKK